jgi:uncharacterized protein (TIGR03435 family)
MRRLAQYLSSPNAAGRQVVDKTSMDGSFDFMLAYEMQMPGIAPAPDDPPALVLEYALEQQLGLKLVNSRAPFDFIVIGRGEKVPIEN